MSHDNSNMTRGHTVPANSIMEVFLIKVVVYLPKLFASVVGAIFALVLSGGIDKDGNIKVTKIVVIQFTFATTLSIYGGETIIEVMELQDKSVMYHGFIMLTVAVFGMLLVGIIYQSIELMRGKSLSEVVKELREVFFIITGR